MTPTLAAVLQVALLVVPLVVAHRPLGAYLARTYTATRHLRAEKLLYRLSGVDSAAEQRWPVYLRGVLAFSAVSVLALYGLQRLQHWLPLSLGRQNVAPDMSWNTAASFVTNTNWQSYSGEQVMGHLVQMAGLAVQNFVSAAVGMAVAVALVRGLARSRSGTLGNFWVDLTRGTLRVLLPIAFVAAIVLIGFGAVQNLTHGFDAHTMQGLAQHIPGGPVASQEAIKELGTNGGGFYNANSAHPFEDPTGFTSLFQCFLILLIPTAMPYMFGRMVGDKRQGYAVIAAMAVIWLGAVVASGLVEAQHPGAAPSAAGAAMEGKETRFGVAASSLFSVTTTMTSTGAVNSWHDSYTALGGGITMFDMQLGEVTPGGVGSGLYGALVLAVLAVFLAGLMVGRTPEYLGKRIGAREMKLVGLYILVMPATVLALTSIAVVTTTGTSSMLNPGPHGLSEALYAFSSAANNNGSAFGGLSANTPFYNIGTGLAVLLGRFVPMVLVLALAGSLAKQQKAAVSVGSMPTHTPLFTVLFVGVIVIVAGLTFLPALALGPLAEGLA